MTRKLTRDIRFLPARDGKESADAWVPPERAIRLEGREMETARGHREDEQRVDERRYARLPISCSGSSQRTRALHHQHPRKPAIEFKEITKFNDKDDDTKTHHPTRSRDPSASQPFFPMRKRANSGAARWCMVAKPTVETSSVGRWGGRCSGRTAAMSVCWSKREDVSSRHTRGIART